MSLSIKKLWNKFITNLAKVDKTLPAYLQQPAKSGDLAKFKQKTGIDFPKSLAEIYLINNGGTEKNGLFFGLKFLSILEISQEMLSWKDIENATEFYKSHPENHIKKMYKNERWIPFAYDWGGNYIGIDLDPDTEGSEEQIINFGRNEYEKFVFAPNLNTFLENVLKIMKEEKISIHEEQKDAITFAGCDHFIDYLKTKKLKYLS